jgi:hypothetical protein
MRVLLMYMIVRARILAALTGSWRGGECNVGKPPCDQHQSTPNTLRDWRCYWQAHVGTVVSVITMIHHVPFLLSVGRRPVSSPKFSLSRSSPCFLSKLQAVF